MISRCICAREINHNRTGKCTSFCRSQQMIAGTARIPPDRPFWRSNAGTEWSGADTRRGPDMARPPPRAPEAVEPCAVARGESIPVPSRANRSSPRHPFIPATSVPFRANRSSPCQPFLPALIVPPRANRSFPRQSFLPAPTVPPRQSFLPAPIVPSRACGQRRCPGAAGGAREPFGLKPYAQPGTLHALWASLSGLSSLIRVLGHPNTLPALCSS